MGHLKRSHHKQIKKQSTTLLNFPASLQRKTKILNPLPLTSNMHFTMSPFWCPNFRKLDKFLIKLTKSIYNIPMDSPNIFTQLPRDAFRRMLQFIVNKYNGAEYLPLLECQAWF